MLMDDALQRQISAAIIQLRLRSPFFATLTLFARIIPTLRYRTAATDGRDIFINPHFWDSLIPSERLGLLAHEVLHAALLHILRRGNRDPLLWNIAADIVVNGAILAEAGFTLPAGHLRERNLEHLSVEEVYHKIKAQPGLQELLHLLFADLLEAPDGIVSPDAEAALAQYWRQALEQGKAMLDVLGYGTLPLGLRRELMHISPSQLDWRSYLWRFLVQTPTDFQDFDRRFVGQGLYLDTLAGEKLRIFIAIDTSGSIKSQEISLFLGEVQAILGAYPHLEATLYYTDAYYYGPYELSVNSEFPPPKGGGGTDFEPFFRAVEATFDTNHNGVYVYLTDGYGHFPNEQPSLSVLWVLSPGGIDIERIPFGEAVRLITDDSIP